MATKQRRDENMLEISVMAKLIWDNWQILLFLFDEENRPLSIPTFCEEAEKAVTPNLLEQLWENVREKQAPAIYIDEKPNLYYWGFENEKKLYVLGPLHAEPLSFTQERHFLHQQKIHRKDFPLKELTFAESFSVVSLVYYCLTGKQYDILSDPSNRKLLEFDLMMNRLDTEIEKRTHLSYQVEQKWYQGIRDGKNMANEWIDSKPELLDKVGILAKENAFKQMEYTMVSQIVLSTRAAIEGGLPPARAYEISDLFLQKCAQCQEMTELLQIGNQSVDSFCRAVRETQKKQTKDLDVERCKNYIAGHLTKKLSVSAIARELNISYSYLAAKFQQETKTSIKKYILQEKLTAATNLLKYSEAGVGDIAHYLAFPSTSSMCSQFKKAYGMSPLEYRHAQKTNDFSSSEHDVTKVSF